MNIQVHTDDHFVSFTMKADRWLGALTDEEILDLRDDPSDNELTDRAYLEADRTPSPTTDPDAPPWAEDLAFMDDYLARGPRSLSGDAIGYVCSIDGDLDAWIEANRPHLTRIIIEADASQA